MNSGERKEMVAELRKRDIAGKTVILRPVTADYAEDIINLRNKPRNMYYLNQASVLTLEEQKVWLESYNRSVDDIYWCILDQKEIFIGTIRLYGIDMNGEFCEEGSYAVREEVADEAPYAVEAKMLILDTAFETLQIRKVINDNRIDNKIMNNMDDQLGFDAGWKREIKGTEHIHRTLTAQDYWKNRSKFFRLVEYWSER